MSRGRGLTPRASLGGGRPPAGVTERRGGHGCEGPEADDGARRVAGRRRPSRCSGGRRPPRASYRRPGFPPRRRGPSPRKPRGPERARRPAARVLHPRAPRSPARPAPPPAACASRAPRAAARARRRASAVSADGGAARPWVSRAPPGASRVSLGPTTWGRSRCPPTPVPTARDRRFRRAPESPRSPPGPRLRELRAPMRDAGGSPRSAAQGLRTTELFTACAAVRVLK
ncbi:uncharacterized protein C10orf95-like [Dipodomys merriami]|uniref:uncharacterized protein C10orf95-like n=1 Tax=Dipodomys merriami TaxID=94247 RepID=UPI0038560BB5